MKNQSRHVRANYFFRELPVTTKPLIASAKVAFKLGGAILKILPVFLLRSASRAPVYNPTGGSPQPSRAHEEIGNCGLVKRQNHGIGAGGPWQFSIECSPTTFAVENP
jgi:hypothetical protein